MEHSEVNAQLSAASEAIDAAQSVPPLLHDEAFAAYSSKTLPKISEAINTLTSLRRSLVEQALADGSLTRREIAESAGLDLSTVQRWSKQTR